MIKKIKKQKQAQIFSTDIIIAVVTFVIILIATMWVWEYTQEKITSTEKRNDLEIITKNSLSILIETTGNPSNWTNFPEEEFNRSNIDYIGLSDSNSFNNLDITVKGKSSGLSKKDYLILDEFKIAKLVSLNSQKYDTYRKILGILGPNYHFQLTINQWDGNSYSQLYWIGSIPQGNATNIVRADRFALLNQTWTNVIFKVWQECEGLIC